MAGLRTGIFTAPIQIQEILHWLIHGLMNGRSAVLLFFVLSGYVLMLQWEGQTGTGLQKYLAFVARRLFRIMPALWLSIFFAYALATTLQLDLGALSPSALFRNLTLQDTEINPVTWSVAAEIVCSLLFPLVIYAHRRISLVGHSTLFLFLLAILIWSRERPYVGYMVFFHVGLLVHEWGPRLSNAVRSKRAWFAAAFLMCGFMPQLWVFGTSVTGNRSFELALLGAQAGPTFLLVALVIYGRWPPLDKMLAQPALRFVGQISFSLYLFHYVVAKLFWTTYLDKVSRF